MTKVNKKIDNESIKSPLSKTDILRTTKTTPKPRYDKANSDVQPIKKITQKKQAKRHDNSLRTNVQIDWLQVWCLGALKTSFKYDAEKLSYGTKTFEDVYVIRKKGFKDEIATIACKPRSKILNPKGALIKLKNNILYSANYCDLLNDILIELGFVFQSISRLDLAIDFNKFLKGLLPEKLIKKYVTGTYTKIGRNKFNIYGEQDDDVTFQTLRFGNNNSNVSVYLYNKSKELEQKTMKHYIVEQWQQVEKNGKKLDIDNVWRLEISIKGNAWKYADSETGEIRPLEINDLNNVAFLEGTYFEHLKKHFDIRLKQKGKKRSRLNPVLLFTEVYDRKSFVRSYNSDESNRMDKIFVRMMENYNYSVRSSRKDREFETEALSLLTADYVKKKGLHKFYYDKFGIEP